jgi:hypothetical protein
VSRAAPAGSPDATVSARRLVTILLTLAILTVLALSPAFDTGYVSDDLANSLVRGMVKLNDSSLVRSIWEWNLGMMRCGRFFPLQLAEIWSVFYLIPNLTLYRSFVILTVVANLLLFFGFVWQVSKRVDFAAFTSVLLIGLFQFRAFCDPILSFAGIQQCIFGTFLVSLMTLQHFLETNKRRWMTGSVVAYLVTLLTYEGTYPFFLIHFLIICHHRRGWIERLLSTLPFVGTTECCGLTTVVLRMIFHTADDGYTVGTSVRTFLTTLLWQTTSALPLSYFLADPASLFTGLLSVKTLVTFVGSVPTVFIFASVFISVCRSLRNGPTGGGRPAVVPARLLLLMGLALIILPALLISLCVKYQRWITPGKGYIPVYIEYYGVALMFATVAWEVFSRLPAGGFRSRWPRFLMACLVAAVGALTYQANVRVAKALAKPPEAPDFNPIAGAMMGCHHNHRLNLEAALRAGLVEEVPDHSLVFLANEYHWWYEWMHASQFYAMHSSKKLTAVPLVNSYAAADAPVKENLLASAGSTRPFLVRDVSLSAKAG